MNSENGMKCMGRVAAGRNHRLALATDENVPIKKPLTNYLRRLFFWQKYGDIRPFHLISVINFFF